MTETLHDPDLASYLDAHLGEPALLLAPSRRDKAMRLLLTADARAALLEPLRSAGYLKHRDLWALFDGSSIRGVQLLCIEELWPGSEGARRLLAGSGAVTGQQHLRRAAPATDLLVLAHDVASRRGELTAQARSEVDAALAEDADAWLHAAQLAPDLGMTAALTLLRGAHLSSSPLTPAVRLRSTAAAVVGAGSGARAWKLLKESVAGQRRSTLVSFSGLDGAGKSTQLNHLRDVFDFFDIDTGYDHATVATAWRFRFVMAVMDAPARLRPGRRAGRRPLVHDPQMPASCEDSVARQHMWVAIVAAVNLAKFWSRAIAYRGSRRVFLIDRFTPDVAIKIDFHYRERKGLDVRRQQDLFTRLAPRPDIGFLVATPGPVAHARRGEWEPEELVVMARSYEQQVERFGLVRFDGTQPAEVLHEQIAATTWGRLR